MMPTPGQSAFGLSGKGGAMSELSPSQIVATPPARVAQTPVG